MDAWVFALAPLAGGLLVWGAERHAARRRRSRELGAARQAAFERNFRRPADRGGRTVRAA